MAFICSVPCTIQLHLHDHSADPQKGATLQGRWSACRRGLSAVILLKDDGDLAPATDPTVARRMLVQSGIVRQTVLLVRQHRILYHYVNKMFKSRSAQVQVYIVIVCHAQRIGNIFPSVVVLYSLLDYKYLSECNLVTDSYQVFFQYNCVSNKFNTP